MSEVFSRAYLQGLPAAHRKAEFEKLISPILGEVSRVAREGKTSYAFSMQRTDCLIRSMPLWTAEELIPLFKEKFPDCTVTYEEVWVDETPTRRYLSKQILIDWS